MCGTQSLEMLQQYTLTNYMSTEHNMANLLAEITFRNCNSSLLRQQTINQTFFSICTQKCDPRANHHELRIWPSCRLTMASPDVNSSKKSITAQERDVNTRTMRPWLLRHTTTNFSLQNAAQYYWVVIIQYTVISIQCHDCIFAIIILPKKKKAFSIQSFDQ